MLVLSLPAVKVPRPPLESATTRPHTPCPGGLTSASNPVEGACLYAQQNGFNPSTGSNQSVLINRGVNPSQLNPIPTAPGITMERGGSPPGSRRKYRICSPRFWAIAPTWWRRGRPLAIQPGIACVYTLDPHAAAAYYQNGNTWSLPGPPDWVGMKNERKGLRRRRLDVQSMLARMAKWKFWKTSLD
jgi:hypothetical protein